jgi:hypothetical protein
MGLVPDRSEKAGDEIACGSVGAIGNEVGDYCAAITARRLRRGDYGAAIAA